MSDDILKELADIAVAKKTSPVAAKPKPTAVDVFVKTALFQIEKATAIREGKSSFEVGTKSHDTTQLRSDWFKANPVDNSYWVQFGFHPVPLSEGKEPSLYMPAADIERVIDILGKGVTLAQTNEKFKQRILATAKAAERKKPEATPVERKKRGPNKKKAA